MNRQLNKLKAPSVDLVVPLVVDEENIEKHTFRLRDTIHRIIKKEIKRKNKKPETEYQKKVKSVLKKRRELFKGIFDKNNEEVSNEEGESEDNEPFFKHHNEKLKDQADINEDLIKLSKRKYKQNREYVETTGLKSHLLAINNKDNDAIIKSKLSLSEKIKLIFRNMDNHHDYNLLIGSALISNNLKDLEKDEYVNQIFEKIKNINVNHKWVTLYDNNYNPGRQEFVNDYESSNSLLHYKLYPFNRTRKCSPPKQNKHSYYLEKSHFIGDDDEPLFNYDDMDKLEEEFKNIKEQYDDSFLNEFNFDTSTPFRIHGMLRSENDDVGLMKIDATVDIMCKFEDPNELEKHKSLDEKLNMNREAENLYKEISKFILHKDSDFLDRNYPHYIFLYIIVFIYIYYIFVY